jgi:YHS domain-containing protein
MSSATSVQAHAETSSEFAPAATLSVENLVQRLSVEVDAASERVHTLQTKASQVFVGQQQRLMRFVAVADRIHAILVPRLQALTNVNVFKDITQSVSLELRGPEGRGFHGRTTKLTVPYSDKRPTPMEFSFRVGHDGLLENAVIDYRLQILPVFIKFDSNDQLITPIERPSEEAIAAWIDDKLVGFTQTYFEVYFHDEYQKTNLEIDPVMNVRFPKAFAAGKQEYQRRAYHFYTKESLQLFEEDPSAYIETV